MAEYALPELRVIEAVQAEIATLTVSERRRVLLWLNDYFAEPDTPSCGAAPDVAAVETAAGEAAEELLSPAAEDEDAPEPEDEQAAEDAPAPIADFAEFYNQISPKSSIQKVMCAGYWLQEKEGLDSWRASDISRCLKAADERAKFLSNVLSIEAKRDDPRVLTLAKAGDSIQARKTFALSSTGEMWVEERLGNATLA